MGIEYLIKIELTSLARSFVVEINKLYKNLCLYKNRYSI